MTDLSFVGRAPLIGRIPVELHIDLAKYRGMTAPEICDDLRAALRGVARVTGVDVEVAESEIATAAVQVVTMANLVHGELSVPQAVPEYVEEWKDA